MATKGENFFNNFDEYMSKILGPSKARRLKKRSAKIKELRMELRKDESLTQEPSAHEVLREVKKKTSFKEALSLARKLK